MTSDIDALRLELARLAMKIAAPASPTVQSSRLDRGHRIALRLAEARAAEWSRQGKGEEAEQWLHARKTALDHATDEAQEVALNAEVRGGWKA